MTVPASDPPTPGRALAVYAHPDDPEVSAGGTMARWAAEGAEVWVLVTTRGDKGTSDPAVDPDELAERRIAETASSVEVLGLAGHRHLDHGDGDLEDDRALREEICRVVRELRPDAVLCPDPTAVFFGDGYFNHRDHRVTGWATLDADRPGRRTPALLRRAARRRAARPPGPRRLPLGHARAELLGRHLGAHRAQDRRAVLPPEPARRTPASRSASSSASGPSTTAARPASATPEGFRRLSLH